MGGGSSNEEAIKDLEAFGAPPEIIEQMRTEQRSDDFEVWPENWSCVEMFLRLETQWRTAFNGAVGLDYVAARWMFEVYEVSEVRTMLESLMIMERAALVAMSERAG